MGSRGSVGSSAVAHFSGNLGGEQPAPPLPLPPSASTANVSPTAAWRTASTCRTKNAPSAATPMLVDGHDIPFETFLGFYGDKEPDIDLNFSGEYQSNVHRYTEELFGKRERL